MSDKWKRIVDSIKAFVGLFTMSMGFWISYVLVWFGVGLPQTDWALWVCLALGLLSHRVYLWWLERGAAADNGKESLRQDLSTIHRQQAEIERLTAERDEARKEAERFKSHHFVVGVRGGATHRLMEIIRLMEHDAINEFTERLKAELRNVPRVEVGGYVYYLIGEGAIDNIAKEMVGDSDA